MTKKSSITLDKRINQLLYEESGDPKEQLMPPIPTNETEIDRKLHRIASEARSSNFKTARELSVAVADSQFLEFSYERDGKTLYSGASTVGKYISFLKQIQILRDNLRPATSVRTLRDLEKFQGWLADKVLVYLSDNNCSIKQIKSTMSSLLSEQPPRLPTLENVRNEINPVPPRDAFNFSLKIVSLLRPNLLSMRRRRLLFDKNIIRV